MFLTLSNILDYISTSFSFFVWFFKKKKRKRPLTKKSTEMAKKTIVNKKRVDILIGKEPDCNSVASARWRFESVSAQITYASFFDFFFPHFFHGKKDGGRKKEK